MSAERWNEDGHVLVVEPGGAVRIECVGECRGPFVACDECYGDGTYDPEDGSDDVEVECEACDGSGWDQGVHRCWLASPDFSVAEALDDPTDRDEPGRYAAVYQTWGEFDDFHVLLRRGALAPPADQPSLLPPPPGVREEGR